ncbi:MAG: hypothetical protein GY796_27090 [Chloroflexi bacterium]|nr:hypothetical protein [Chloroflexota bacterium]
MPIFRRVTNFAEPDGPLFSGNFAQKPLIFNGRLKLVSYNIDKGRQVEQGLQDLQTLPPLIGADIILLQEMDEKGTEKIAAALGYNFVYYPASILQGQNFGNGILSRWTILRPQKLILPHTSRFNGQIRIAVRATVLVNGRPLLIYCVHTEIYTASVRHRRNQAAAVINDIPLDAEQVIVGGDFNTVSSRSIRRLTAQFSEAGLKRASKGAGGTVSKYATNSVAADHIFTWGFEALDRGKVKEAQASDHYPLWVELRMIE